MSKNSQLNLLVFVLIDFYRMTMHIHYMHMTYYHLLQLSSGIVGEIGESKDEFYVWTHKKLDIAYNGDQIVDVSLTSESKAKLVPNSKLSFTYEVNNLNEFSYSDCKLNLEITLLLN